MTAKDIKSLGLGRDRPILNGKMDWNDPASGYNYAQNDMYSVPDPTSLNGGSLDITQPFQTDSDFADKLFGEFCHVPGEDAVESGVDSNSAPVEGQGQATKSAPVQTPGPALQTTPQGVLSQHGLMGGQAKVEAVQEVHVKQEYDTDFQQQSQQYQQQQQQSYAQQVQVQDQVHSQQQHQVHQAQPQQVQQVHQFQQVHQHQQHQQDVQVQVQQVQQHVQVHQQHQVQQLLPPTMHHQPAQDHMDTLPDLHFELDHVDEAALQEVLAPQVEMVQQQHTQVQIQPQFQSQLYVQQDHQVQQNHQFQLSQVQQSQFHQDQVHQPQVHQSQLQQPTPSHTVSHEIPHINSPCQSRSHNHRVQFNPVIEVGTCLPVEPSENDPLSATSFSTSAASGQSTPGSSRSPGLKTPPTNTDRVSPGVGGTSTLFPSSKSTVKSELVKGEEVHTQLSHPHPQVQFQPVKVEQFPDQLQSQVQPVHPVQHEFQVPQQAQFQPQLSDVSQVPLQTPRTTPPQDGTFQFQIEDVSAPATQLCTPNTSLTFTTRPWRTGEFQKWYSTQMQLPLEPESAHHVNVCTRLERAALRTKICQDMQHAAVRSWAFGQPLTLEQYDDMNRYEEEVPELAHLGLEEKELRDRDEEKLKLEWAKYELNALDLRNHLMQFELLFQNLQHFHRHRICGETCQPSNGKKHAPGPYSFNPLAHKLVHPSQFERCRQRTHFVKDLFYSCRSSHMKRVRNLVNFLEDDFMKIQVTSERARRVLLTYFKNPYLALFDHIQRQRVPEQVDPHIYQYVESVMDNVYLSAYYRVEAKKGTRKLDGTGGEYIPDEKDIGERYCGICDKWFKTRNHNWASHMTSTHGVCSATKSVYPFPVAVILGVPSTTQKEDELVVHQKISFMTNSDGDLQIQNDSQPRHHLMPDKDIKLSGLCAICSHYVPLYCKRGATVWTTWFRHQDKHIREFNQQRNGGVAVNLNNPRNNKTRKEEICKERMRVWRQQQHDEKTRKRTKHDDMAFLEQGVMVDNVQSGSWLNEEFSMTQAEVTLSYQMEYQQSEGISGGNNEVDEGAGGNEATGSADQTQLQFYPSR